MKKNWEICRKSVLVGRWADHYVTMNPKGEIVLGRFTHQKMGEAAAYLILFDRISNTIGLNPVSQKNPDAYTANARGKYGGRVIRAIRLARQFGIRLTETVRFVNPEIDDDGVLNLNLSTARTAARPRS